MLLGRQAEDIAVRRGARGEVKENWSILFFLVFFFLFSPIHRKLRKRKKGEAPRHYGVTEKLSGGEVVAPWSLGEQRKKKNS